MAGILKSYKIVSSFSFNKKSLKNSIFLTFSVILLSSSFVASDSNNFELFPLAFAAVLCTVPSPDSTCTIDDTVSITETVAATGDFTQLLSDSVSVTDTVATSGNLTSLLPTAVGITGRIYVICKIDSSVNTVTVDGASSENVGKALTAVLADQDESITIQSNGTDWVIL